MGPRSPDAFFSETAGCPFCGRTGNETLDTVRYHETAERNADLPDIEGRLHACAVCGIAYPSHVYRAEAFPLLYAKSFGDLSRFDSSLLQSARTAYMGRIMEGIHRRFSVARLLDALSLSVLQVPRLQRAPLGLKVLDVGCGFGEFMRILAGFGNRVVGTEIVPALVEHGRAAGLDVRYGELESVDYGAERFDVIILRAVFYRTRSPRTTLEIVRRLLADGGEICLVDPCPGRGGVGYFFHKQFPQGQFYIIDTGRYLRMLHDRFGLECPEHRQIYGQPRIALRSIGALGHLAGLFELLGANLLRIRPYVLSYALKPVAV